MSATKGLPVAVAQAFDHCGMSCGFSQDLTSETLEAVERARVVGVLDAWATKHRRFPVPSPADHGNGCFELWLSEAPLIGEGVSRCYVGETCDAARAAAAKAIEAGEV